MWALKATMEGVRPEGLSADKTADKQEHRDIQNIGRDIINTIIKDCA